MATRELSIRRRDLVDGGVYVEITVSWSDAGRWRSTTIAIRNDPVAAVARAQQRLQEATGQAPTRSPALEWQRLEARLKCLQPKERGPSPALRIGPDGESEKYCKRCDEWWPATTAFFYRLRSAKTGLHCWCKACYNERRADMRSEVAQ